MHNVISTVRGRRDLVVVATLVGLLASACSTPVIPGSSVAPSHAVASASEPSSSVAAAAADVSSRTFVDEADGLRLTVTLDRTDVDPDGTVTAQLRLQNDRAVAVPFDEPCLYDSMVVLVPIPTDPVGRDWDGIAGAFKKYALEESHGTPIESSIRDAMPSYAQAEPCHAPATGAPGQTLASLAAGSTYETAMTWTPNLVKGLPLGPGTVPFTISVPHDPQAVSQGGLSRVETLKVEGMITVKSGAPAPVTPGQAIDVVLAGRRFGDWLAKQPRKSWANVNVFLQPGAIGEPALPTVPYWDVELFREPRNWAVLYVDAARGTVLKQTFCDQPCDR